jgi:transposase-like protein
MPGMNKLPTTKRAQILTLLCKGMSMRAVSRIADVSINTVWRGGLLSRFCGPRQVTLSPARSITPKFRL